MLRTITSAIIVVLLSACSGLSVDNYAEFSPILDPEEFFDGQLSAHGVVKNRSGRVIRTFNADIAASWAQGTGTLVEDFVFDDGEQQQRIWTLEPDGEAGYIGTAGDVVGAGQLSAAGNSLFLNYVLRIPYGDSTVDVRVDDRMYLVSPNVLINESILKKFGVRVGSLTLTIIKQETQQ
ncbi:MAG: DUF3833 domain-containing protein [Halioglobus sp.]